MAAPSGRVQIAGLFEVYAGQPADTDLPTSHESTFVTWLPYLGPTATWTWRLLARDVGGSIAFDYLAKQLGINNSTLRTAIDRLHRYRLIKVENPTQIQVPSMVRIPRELRTEISGPGL